MNSWGGNRQGAGRPPKVAGQRRVSLSATVPAELADGVRALARQSGRTLSEAVELLLEAGLKTVAPSTIEPSSQPITERTVVIPHQPIPTRPPQSKGMDDESAPCVDRG